MSRQIKNRGLDRLCKKSNLQIADLACIVQTSLRAIHLLSTGRRHFPILEANLAKLFKMSVPELRKALHLPVTSISKRNTTQRRTKCK